jgi:hypothetical protein
VLIASPADRTAGSRIAGESTVYGSADEFLAALDGVKRTSPSAG